jgi:hypothetical protein
VASTWPAVSARSRLPRFDSDVSVGFLEPSACAGVHPEDELVRACIADAVGVLDGELRLEAVCWYFKVYRDSTVVLHCLISNYPLHLLYYVFRHHLITVK